MRAYDIGLSALRTHQKTLNVIGNNIANAATPGYHRQRIDLTTRIPELDGTHLLGTGVEIGRITRSIDAATEDALLRNSSLQGLVDEELALASDVEALLATGDSSIHEYFSDFFNNIEAVANSPEVDTVRSELLASGESLLVQFNNIYSALERQTQTRLSEARAAVDDINSYISEVATLNRQIREERARHRDPLDLLDRRDAVVTELSKWTDVSVTQDSQEREFVVLAGGALMVSDIPTEVTVKQSSEGWKLHVQDTNHPLELLSGKMKGLLTSINEKIPETQDRLQQLATSIVQAVDRQHAKGLTEDGAHNILHSSRAIERPNTPLIHSGTPFEINRGDLTISVTDPATGTRASHRISVDPYVDSLEDIRSRLNAVPGVSAVLSATTGRLALFGTGSRQVDFAGRVDNVPDLASYTGTGTPTFSGTYTGTDNDDWTVTFNGSGTIGVTDGLTATFTNSDGQVVGSVEVGAGYAAGSELLIANGVSVSFATGTVAAADTATVGVTADSDESGFLAAVGLNSLFSGNNIRTFAVREDILESPELLAISVTGVPGEASNIAAIGDLRDLRFDLLGDRTFIEELADFTAETGLESLSAQNQLTQLQTHARHLEEQRTNVSGVNTDEEFLKILEVERAFQAAAQFISTADETLREVFRIID